MSTDILDLIALSIEWQPADGDAMRWAPMWDEPIVRDPRPGVEILLAAGWDGYAAEAFTAWAAVRAFIAIGVALRGSMQVLARAFGEFGKSVIALHRALAPLMPEPKAGKVPGKVPVLMRDRPAWQSPYGPPAAGKRRR